MRETFDHPRTHLISTEEYFRMGDGVVFAPDARLELIEGAIFEKAPANPPHAGGVMQLNELFMRRGGNLAIVWCQMPLIISGHSVPEPDLALLTPRADYYRKAHPTATDAFLVVEVADITLAFDLGTKVPLYARCGVREAWVVNINERAVHVFRDPAGGGYRSTFVAQVGERVACSVLPEVAVEVGELFPA